ncbi:Low-density lipoprotein receptor- protein 6 [Parelaphostrongylus tenuis]|uniref:Low-density lipoprotein receptor- protein 6 n=1 Tax=Parelaphostrongylus tenuis TaxID=148309 RepID=A0AAD5R5I8_PARTN|nr:Low-density lipoprotein receptor- protein 6 [Parelaphostrongylus tenuis]
MCANLYNISGRFNSSPEWLYILLLGCIMLFCTTVILFCCFRNYPICSTNRPEIAMSSIHHLRSPGVAEASILLPPHPQIGAQVEVSLQAYSMVTSNSSFPALPPPNSTHSLSRSSDSYHRSSIKDIPLNRFYAPPPSAASLSTYGVVKPAEVRFSTLNNRQRLRRKKLSSPPPCYTKMENTATAASLLTMMDCHPRMSSTPKSRHCSTPQSSRHPAVTSRPTPSRLLNSEHMDLLPRSRSSSSISSHSSDNALE